MEIDVKTIIPQQVELLSPDNKQSWIVNEYELLDVRVQIRKKKLKGYKIIFKGKIINMDHNGTFEHEPDGLFDTIPNLLIQLI